MKTHIQMGLTLKEVKKRQATYGPNALQDAAKSGAVRALVARFKNPLVIILLLAASLSLFFGDKGSFIIIVVIVLLSVALDFFNTYRSQKAAEKLKERVRVEVEVIRSGGVHHVP